MIVLHDPVDYAYIKMHKPKQNQKGFSVVEIMLVLVFVALIGMAGYFVYKDHHATRNIVIASVTDSWTGLGQNDEWSNPKNWSNGIPKNDETIKFNAALLANFKTEGSQGYVVVNNDLSNLIINNIDVLGVRRNDSILNQYEIVGKKFTILHGITNSSNTELTIEPTITLSGNQTFGNTKPIISSSPGYKFYDGELQSAIVIGNLNIGNYTLTVTDSALEINGMLTGNGTLNDTGVSTLSVNNNPGFSGSLNVMQNSYVGIDAKSQSASPLGTAVVNLNSGSNLDISYGHAIINLSNKISVGGNGGVQAGNSNQYLGAISLCGGTLTITGLVSLTSNTLFSGCPEGDAYSTIHLAGGLVTNNYSLSAQSGTLLSIIK